MKISRFRIFHAVILLIVAAVGLSSPPCQAEIQLFADHQVVENTAFGTGQGYEIIDDNRVVFAKASPHHYTWAYFKITGVEKKTVTFQYTYTRKTNLNTVKYRTPVIFYSEDHSDDRINYEFCKDYKAEIIDEQTVYTFTHVFKHDTAFVAYAPIHTNTQVTTFINEVKNHPFVTRLDTIGHSHIYNLPMTVLYITDPAVDDAKKTGVWLLGREDAYETGGSLAVMGATRFLLSDDPIAAQLRKQYVFWILPIFSQDGVQMGHTNYPINASGSQYIYVTAQWNRPDRFPEVKTVLDDLAVWKERGRDLALFHRFHSASYYVPYFRPAHTNQEELRTTFYEKVLRDQYLPHYTLANVTLRDTRATFFAHQLWPDALTSSSHSDFVIYPDTIGNDQPIHRTNQAVYQDGELMMRGWAQLNGIPDADLAPPFLTAGEVTQNHAAQGETITYRVLYRDLRGKPPVNVTVVIDGQPHEMQRSKGEDFSKGIFYTLDKPLAGDVNGFYFTARNETGSRRIPVLGEYPGPFTYEK